MNKELYHSYAVLKKVYLQGAYSSIELNKILSSQIPKLNYALVTKIVYGVLEKDIYLEYMINKFLKNSCEKSIFVLLKMGAYVSKFINSIPNYALINECVQLSKKENPRLSGFVNATLKNIANSNFELPNKENSNTKYLSVKYSYPEWAINQLLKNHDINWLEKMLSCELTTLTHIRIINEDFKKECAFGDDRMEVNKNYSKIINDFKQKLTQLNITFQTSQLPFTLYVDYEKLIKVAELKNKYVVQGLPSVLVALNINPKSNESVLDCASAPGGKTALIAELNKDCKVVACDIHPHRVKIIDSFLNKLNIKNVTTKVADATVFNPDWQCKFDKVLCDVPCSGLGVINKKPDILLNRTSLDVKTLSGVQFKILQNNAKYVKPGGCLIYSTCTIMKEENEDVVRKFLKLNPSFKLEKINTFGINCASDENMLTFYPHISNTEGFFISKLTRIN